jgi:hypothetical protein
VLTLISQDRVTKIPSRISALPLYSTGGTDIMDGMTDEEIDFTLRCYESGLDAEDIYNRLNEEVPYTSIEDLISCYEDSMMSEMEGAEFYA